MSKLEWQESYSVNIQVIDDQHKQLIALINQLHSALETNQENEVISEIIDGVIDYTHKHFDFEEEFLEKHGYPHLEEHKKLHADYRTQMAEMKEQFDNSRMFFKPKLVRVLLTWFKSHILTVDMEYSRFLKEEKKI